MTSERARPRRPGAFGRGSFPASRRTSSAAPPTAAFRRRRHGDRCIRLLGSAGGNGGLTGPGAAVRYSAPIPRRRPVTSAATALHPAVCCCLSCRAAPQRARAQEVGTLPTLARGRTASGTAMASPHRPADLRPQRMGPQKGPKKGTNFPTLGDFSLNEKEVYLKSGRNGWTGVNLPADWKVPLRLHSNCLFTPPSSLLSSLMALSRSPSLGCGFAG